jgi:hypothetical protein
MAANMKADPSPRDIIKLTYSLCIKSHANHFPYCVRFLGPRDD